MTTRDVIVIIGGEELNAFSDLKTIIPRAYIEQFNGHSFKNMHEFSMAVMFAKCAQDGLCYGNSIVLQNNEKSLFSLLGKDN